MPDRTIPSDFYFAGILTTSRVANFARPAIRAYLEEARRNQWKIDPEFHLWTRAMLLEGERWATYGDVSRSDPQAEIPAESMSNEQLTVAEVAELLGVKPPTVRFHVRERRISPARRNPYMFDPAEVARFVAIRETA